MDVEEVSVEMVIGSVEQDLSYRRSVDDSEGIVSCILPSN